MARGLFITGTDTGVGKTYVAALIARALAEAGYNVGVYKPIASGCEQDGGALTSPDAVALWEAAGRPGTLDQVCPQRFAAPLAPHRAAWAEGSTVDARLLRGGLAYWLAESEIIVVEGSGGLMSPLSDDDYNADLAKDFGFPLVVVSANVLGTINATLQTLITAETYCDGLSVGGVVLNWPQPATDDPSTESNREELDARCVTPVLTEVRYGEAFDESVDWWELAGGINSVNT